MSDKKKICLFNKKIVHSLIIWERFDSFGYIRKNHKFTLSLDMMDSLYIQQTSLLLHAYANSVKSLGKLNLHDINVHSENFFRDFLNCLRDWELRNANEIQSNEAGIDLIDDKHKIVIQVSSESTKKKIQESINKTDLGKYKNFRFYFLSLTTSAKNLRDKEYMVPQELVFHPETNILDIDGIIAEVNSKPTAIKEDLYNITVKHLGPCVIPQRNTSSLAKVIKALEESAIDDVDLLQKIPFVIQTKITENKLDAVSGSIQDHVIYLAMLNQIYCSYEGLGKNTRTSIHSMLRRYYEEGKEKMTPVALYHNIIDKACNLVMCSSNCPADMTIEDIQWAISVVVADAFEDCKIFEHPQNI